jgi:outer membrane protein insertion porin family
MGFLRFVLEKKTFALFLAAFALFLASAFSVNAAPQKPANSSAAVSVAPRVEQVLIEGNQRIESETIRSYLVCDVGMQCSSDALNQSIKRLFATGLFSELDVEMQGNILHVRLKENPVINKLVFEGNKRIKEENLQSEVRLKSRSVYSRAKVQADVERIQALYRRSGRYQAVVVPKVIVLDQNRINLVYEIDEGKKIKIKKLAFVGNQYASARKLETVINTKESSWYRFLSSADTYDRDRVAYDRELIRRFYRSEGFADVNVLASKAEMTKNSDSFIVTFTIEEGARYDFGEIKISSEIPNLSTEELEKLLLTKSGETFNANEIDESVESMTQKAGEFGYAFIDIDPVYERDEAQKILNLNYVISEGPRVYIRNINITGNVRTLDKVIRREFRLQEGDPFNSDAFKRSEQRVRNLGYFEKIDMKKSRTEDPDKMDVDVAVTERSTGELNFGAGFSSTEGALATTSLRERNLLGRGQEIGLSLQKTARGAEADASFTEPYFMDMPLAAGVDVFTSTRDLIDESSYESKSRGFGFRAGYDLTERLRHSVRYQIRDDTIRNVRDDASLFIKRQAGDNITSLIGQSLFYDRLDNRQEPSKGYSIRLSQDFAGIGGDSKFIRHEAKSAYYYPVYKNDVIFSALGNAGNIYGYESKTVRINERFLLGGQNLRGFQYSGVGPRDQESNDSLGGNSFLSGTLETTFPLGLPQELGVRGAAFIDAGSLWDSGEDVGVLDNNSIRASYGVGASWNSPMGPIRLDVANAFLKESYDRTRHFSLNFGTRF